MRDVVEDSRLRRYRFLPKQTTPVLAPSNKRRSRTLGTPSPAGSRRSVTFSPDTFADRLAKHASPGLCDRVARALHVPASPADGPASPGSPESPEPSELFPAPEPSLPTGAEASPRRRRGPAAARGAALAARLAADAAATASTEPDDDVLLHACVCLRRNAGDANARRCARAGNGTVGPFYVEISAGAGRESGYSAGGAAKFRSVECLAGGRGAAATRARPGRAAMTPGTSRGDAPGTSRGGAREVSRAGAR